MVSCETDTQLFRYYGKVETSLIGDSQCKDLFRAWYLRLTMKDWLDFDRRELSGKWTFLVPRTVCACSHR